MYRYLLQYSKLYIIHFKDYKNGILRDINNFLTTISNYAIRYR